MEFDSSKHDKDNILPVLAAERRLWMNLKRKIKTIIDSLMTILLLLLMAFQITGQEFHRRKMPNRMTLMQ